MDFELAVEAEALNDPRRLKSLHLSRSGKPRSQALKIVWHDSPDHALQARNLCLAETRGTWRLERLAPGEETWLPAQPAQIIAEAPRPDDLPDLPAPLAPLAAFEGRRSVSTHDLPNGQVLVAVEKGVLRTVAAEQAVARILLRGEDEAVRQAAILIAGAIPANVPRACLAAEAIAIAANTAPAPRHRGAPLLPKDVANVPAALSHILGHLTDVILGHASGSLEDTETVHQMRVAVRRARSALAIFHPVVNMEAMAPIREGLKALGRQLGPTRDWDVFTEETAPAIQAVLPDDVRLTRLAAAAMRRRDESRKALADYLASPGFRLLTIELAWFCASTGWSIQPEDEAAPPLTLDDFATNALQQRWKKLVSSGKRMEEMDIPSLHGVRLRAKQARYVAEMFAPLWPGKPARRYIRRLGVLQQRLGVLNDGAVATSLLDELGGAGGRHGYAVGIVSGFMAAHAQGIRPRIVKAFERFRKQPGFWS